MRGNETATISCLPCAVCLVLSWQHMRDKFAMRPRNRAWSCWATKSWNPTHYAAGLTLSRSFLGTRVTLRAAAAPAAARDMHMNAKAMPHNRLLNSDPRLIA